MDFSQMMTLKGALDSISQAHPKLPGFIQGVRSKGFEEGQEIAVAVRYPDGTEYKCGIRVRQSDLEALETLKSLKP